MLFGGTGGHVHMCRTDDHLVFRRVSGVLAENCYWLSAHPPIPQFVITSSPSFNGCDSTGSKLLHLILPVWGQARQSSPSKLHYCYRGSIIRIMLIKVARLSAWLCLLIKRGLQLATVNN